MKYMEILWQEYLKTYNFPMELMLILSVLIWRMSEKL